MSKQKPAGESGLPRALGARNDTTYFNAFPHEGQNLSVAITGLPHFGQKPSNLTLYDLRRAAIIDSIASSVSSVFGRDFFGDLPPSRRGPYDSFKMSILRRMSAPFWSRLLRWTG
jgi:hypothetical protein